MKFKQRDVQNQRIERISTNHLIIGIDIAKERHVARAVTYRGLEIGRPVTFENQGEGFGKLLRWIGQLQQQKGLSSLIIGLEPTGHYWFSLADWLMDLGHEVVLVNPLTTKRNKENRDNSQSKNDIKDALVIADAVSRGYYTTYNRHAAIYRRLRMVMNDREYWVKQLTSLKGRLHRWLDIHFPEYRLVFSDWEIARSVATLKAFPLPEDIAPMTAEQMITGWKEEGGMKRAGGKTGLETAARLLAVARSSVGSKVGCEEARKEIARLVEDYERLTERLKEMEHELDILLAQVPDVVNLLRTIKGLSTLFIAALLAGCGEISKYAHGQQILSQAGLNLTDNSSGKYEGKVGISKRGRRQLRKYLYLGTLSLITNNPQFKRWHEQNVKEKKMKKHRSVFKLIGKLTRIMIGMVKRGEAFRANDVQEAAA
ncbi:IS110 family transposase [Paenibacillus sp. MBLB4367]|uniref:IS110 family transposase n=1 Tax=Paenibacillus sp. MBLB4367 TaxID=3384767 RepID=UPI003908335C